MKEISFRKGVYMEDKPLNIAILGLGSVGGKVVELLAHHQKKMVDQTGRKIQIKTALVRSVTQPDKRSIAQRYGIELTESIETITNDPEIELVIELLGRIHPAKEYIEACLMKQKSVITANKDLVASHGASLNDLAQTYNVALLYEASVGGGIPIIQTLQQQFAFDEITKMTGILNGTTNFILSKMLDEALSYEDALALAQELGYAESDPFNDVSGTDAAYKAIVLAQVVYKIAPSLEQVALEGIEDLSSDYLALVKQFGYKVKLLATIKAIAGQVELQVAPTLIDTQQLLAQIDQETNALVIESKQIGQTFLSGPGAGAAPTASSVLADLYHYLTTQTSTSSSLKLATLGKKTSKIYGICFEQPTQIKNFTNQQLTWIDTIVHQTVETKTYIMVRTKPILEAEKTQLCTQIAELTSFSKCLEVFDAKEKEDGQ